MKRWEVIGWIVGVLAAVVVIVLVFRWDSQNTADQNRREAEGFTNANAACAPAKPSAIVHHGSGWSNTPYWEVTCPDGSTQLIDAYPDE